MIIRGNKQTKESKKIILFIVFVFTVLGVFVVNGYNKKSGNITANLELQEDVYNYLKKNDLLQCNIIQCPLFKDLIEEFSISQEELDVTVTDLETRNYIKKVLKSYERLVNVKDHKKVKEGDFVTVSFSVYFQGRIISPRKNVTLKVGAGYYDKQFESVLVGMKKGEVYKRTLIVPDNFEDETMIGKKETFRIRVLAIQKYKKYKLNNKFVRKKLGVNNVREYYEIARKSVLERKKNKRINQMTENILDKIINTCQFQLDQEEVVQYALDRMELEEKLADIGGMTMDEYIKKEGKDRKSFFSSCYQSAEKMIKEILVVGILAEQMHIDLSDDDFGEKLDSKDVDLRYSFVKRKTMLNFLKETG